MIVKRNGRGDPMLLIQPIRPAVTQKKGEILIGIVLDVCMNPSQLINIAYYYSVALFEETILLIKEWLFFANQESDLFQNPAHQVYA